MHKPSYHRHKLCLVALSAIITALISGGCTNTDEPGGNRNARDEGKVTFGAYVCNTAATRASVSNIHTLKQSGFGVFASITGKLDFQDNPASGGFTPNYMYNQKVAWQGSADRDSCWVYEPELFWPGTQKVSFFAYSPYTDKANGTITSWSGINDSGSPEISVSISDKIDKQVDLLYANALNLCNSPSVPMNFKHAFSRISIQLSVGSDIDPNSSISINRITFKSADLGTRGVLNLGTGKWSNISGTTEHLFSGTDTDAMKKGFMVIPTDNKATLEITADYTLTTKDSKLPSGSFTIANTTVGSFSIGLQAGSSYCLKLQLNLKSIDISASIHDWDDENHTWESDQNHNNEIE